MKTYYIECEVKYKNEGEFDDSEYYSFIFNANNKISAISIARTKALNEFEIEMGKDFETDVEIIDIYETSSDARK